MSVILMAWRWPNYVESCCHNKLCNLHQL